MTNEKTKENQNSALQESPFYPRFELNRVDEMLEELSSKQILKLYDELKTIGYGGWMNYIVENMANILTYDELTTPQRNKTLQSASIQDLLSHHACIFLALRRNHIEKNYMQIHHNPILAEERHQQISLILSVFCSFRKVRRSELWAFDHHEILDHPFFPPEDD